MHDRIAYQGITFDDVLLEPGYSDLLPHEVDTKSHLTNKRRRPIGSDSSGVHFFE